jgi:hypothetical protein
VVVDAGDDEMSMSMAEQVADQKPVWGGNYKSTAGHPSSSSSSSSAAEAAADLERVDQLTVMAFAPTFQVVLVVQGAYVSGRYRHKYIFNA